MTSNLPARSTLPWDSLPGHPHHWDSSYVQRSTSSYRSNGNDSGKPQGSVAINNNNNSNYPRQVSTPDRVYTQGPIDGNLYATVCKPSRLSESSPHHPTSTSFSSFSTFKGSADMSSDESRGRNSIDSGVSSVNSINRQSNVNNNNNLTMTTATMINGKSSSVRHEPSETNNNTVMPNEYKVNSMSSPAFNVEAIVHRTSDGDSDMKVTSYSETQMNGKHGNEARNSNGQVRRISEKEQAALDELLSGMLREVENFPDYPIRQPTSPQNVVTSSTTKTTSPLSEIARPVSPTLDTVDGPLSPNDSVSGRSDARPSSPVPPLTDHFGKIEPLPVRFLTKASPTSPDDEKSRPYHARPGSQPFTYGVTETSPALQRRRVVSESTAYIVESRPKPSQDEIDSNGPSSLDDSSSGLSWLQRQQMKLKNRHEIKDSRGKDLVLAELRGIMGRSVDYSSVAGDSEPPTPNQTSPLGPTYSSSPVPRTPPTTLPALNASPIPRATITSNLVTPPTPPSPQSPPLPPSSRIEACSDFKLTSSLASSPTYSRPLHINTNEALTSNISNGGGSGLNSATLDSPSIISYTSGVKPSASGLSRQNSIPTTPNRFANSASGSTSPLTYTQIRDNYAYGRTMSSPEPGRDSPSVYFGQSQRSSLLSLNESDIISQHPSFIKDTSKFWYKPTISREEAIKLLLDKPPGTFIIRDSNSFPGAFGLALKVAQPPPDVQNKSGDTSHELVRHFLIEPTSKGVRIKGCPNEPVFASLSALVYQHSITPLALSCKLIIPETDLSLISRDSSGYSHRAGAAEAAEILAQGAACNVLYLLSVETESLTGPQAVRNAVSELLSRKTPLNEIIVHFKVSVSGITLTDNSHRNFFRRHYPLTSVSHFGLDPEGRCYKPKTSNTRTSQLFGFVARRKGLNKVGTNNECHLFVEYDEDQPASAIVNFANKVILSIGRDNQRK